MSNFLVGKVNFPQSTFYKPISYLQNNNSKEENDKLIKKRLMRKQKIAKIYNNYQEPLASEILKNFNFSINPQNYDDKKEQIRDVLSLNQYQKEIVAQSITRSISGMRKRHINSNISLEQKPILQQTKSIKNGTLSILKNNSEARNYITNKYKGFVKTKQKELGENGKDKLRLQVIKWFKQHKIDVIENLFEKENQIIQNIEEVDGVNRKEFYLILASLGMGKDRNVINRLFWLFDLNNDNYIDANEIAYAINLFRNESLEQKIEIFFELCDEDKNGFISYDELKNFLVKNLNKENDINKTRFQAYNLWQEINYQNKNEGFSKLDLLEACNEDTNIQIIIEKNTRLLRAFKSENVNLGSLIPIQETDQKQGCFFPLQDKYFAVITEKDRILNKYIGLQENTNQTQKLKIRQGMQNLN